MNAVRRYSGSSAEDDEKRKECGLWGRLAAQRPPRHRDEVGPHNVADQFRTVGRKQIAKTYNAEQALGFIENISVIDIFNIACLMAKIADRFILSRGYPVAFLFRRVLKQVGRIVGQQKPQPDSWFPLRERQ